MGQIDFAKIISAAAVSTLGVLALIVVALGVIAYFFFKGSPEKVKLSVWLTMVLAGGMFAAAFINQAGRDNRGPDPKPVETAEPVIPPGPGPTASDTPDPEPSDTPSARPSATVTPPVRDADTADLSGRWHDNDGFFYDVTAYGNVFAYVQYLNGVKVGSGQGSVNGRTLHYGFLSTQAGAGQCDAIVATDDQSISGSCTSGGPRWQFFIER